MKIHRLIRTVGAMIGATAFAFAQPSEKSTTSPASRTTEAFQKIKAGDRVALVCKQCETVTVQTVASTDDAMKLCQEGNTVTGPSCKKTYKVTRTGFPGKNETRFTRVVYTNDKGEECMFVAQLND